MFLRSTIAGIVIAACTIGAQNNETLNVYGSLGYGLGTGGQLFSSTTLLTSANGLDTVERKDHYFNYGQGFKIDLGVQYFMMENVALQAGLCFSAGTPDLETTFRHDTTIGTGLPRYLDSTTSYNHNLFGIKVLAVPRFEILELMNVHTGIGIGFYWNSLNYEITRATQNETREEKGTIKSSPTLGLIGLMGAEYPLTDLLSLFGEIGFEQMSFKWNKRKVESSQLRNPGSYIYEKDAPNQDPPLRIPGSNWRIGIGARYVLF